MSEERCLGVVRIGEMAIAIPAEQLQEVVSDPLPLSPLPDAPAFVLGQAILHERDIAPVVAVSDLLHPPTAPSTRPPLLVFLRSEAGRVAILADEVLKVIRPPAKQFARLSTSGNQTALFRESFTDGVAVINILEVGALAEYSGVRFAEPTAITGGETEAQTNAVHTFTLFRSDELVFAIDIEAASHAMLVPELIGTQVPSPLLHGFFDFHGQQTVLLNLRRLLELPGLPRDSAVPERMLAMEHGGSTIAVGITDVLGMEKHTAARIEPLTDCGLPCAALYRGTLHSGAHGKVLVLDHAAIFAHAGVRNLVSIHDCVAKSQAKSQAEARFTFMVYRAGGSALATRMDQLEAVLRYPTDLVALRRNQEPFLGFFSWQNKTIALLDLGALLGTPQSSPDREQARVLIVKKSNQTVGFLVDRVDSLQDAVVKNLPQFAARGTMTTHLQTHLPPFNKMISVRAEQGDFNASILDLKAIGLPQNQQDSGRDLAACSDPFAANPGRLAELNLSPVA